MPVDAEACEGGLRAYLGGGPDDPSDATVEAFGERNPFSNCANGFDGIINAILKVSNDPNEFPSENDPELDIGASYLGSLVARASLSSQEKTAIKLFIRHARAGHLVHYEDALKAGLAELATKGSSPQDEARVQRETGMPLVQSLALIIGMATFFVPSANALKMLQHGMDPLQWSGFKQQAKLGQKTFLDFMKPKADARELRQKLRKVVQSLREKGFLLASATLMTWIDELSEITFEQGVDQFFLDYYNEYMETHRSRGLIVGSPLDDDLVRRKVLCQRGGARARSSPTWSPSSRRRTRR